MKRRRFLQLGSAALALAHVPVWARSNNPNRRLVVFFLEGGLDGLSALVPKGETALESFRESLLPGDLLDLNAHWALDPSLRSIHKMILAQDILGVHATSFPYTKRSHFEGQNFIQGAGKAPFSEDTGWIGRALDLVNFGGRAMSLDTPLLLRGSTSIDNFFPANVPGSYGVNTELLKSLEAGLSSEWQTANAKLIDRLNVQVFQSKDRSPRALSEEAGRALKQKDGPLAAMIRLSGYDTHATQGTRLSGNLAELDNCVDALKRSLGETWDNTTFITLTEFGRTVRVNGSSGSDHGYGTCMFIGGGAVKGGAVLADWPGLAKSDQFEKRDLMATLDARSLCAAALEHTLGIEHDELAERVFFEPNLKRVTDQIYL